VLFHGIVIDALEAARARQARSLAQSREIFEEWARHECDAAPPHFRMRSGALSWQCFALSQ
jgi:hypothetical protein